MVVLRFRRKFVFVLVLLINMFIFFLGCSVVFYVDFLIYLCMYVFNDMLIYELSSYLLSIYFMC